MEKLISVIIPIYNGQEYIHSFISSISNQSFKDIEYIFVNDGSIDNTLQMLKRYSERNKNIKIINQANKGPSSARNTGLKHAEGRYIGFLDIDDKFHTDMYKELSNQIIKEKSDMVICAFNKLFENGDVIKESLPYDYSPLEKEKIKNDFILKLIGKPKENSKESIIYGSVCRALYKLDIIKEYNITFDENIRYSEDLLFNLTYVLKSNSISINNNPFYTYVIGDESTTRNYMPNLIDSTLKVNNHIQNLTENENINELNHYMKWRWRRWTIILIVNLFKNGNSNTLRQKKKEVSELINSSEVTNAFNSIKLKEVMLKHKALYFFIKQRNALIITLYYNTRKN